MPITLANYTAPDTIIPPKLRPGDTVGVIAPSTSGAIISDDVREYAVETLGALGLRVVFAPHVDATSPLGTASIEERVADIHAMYADPNINGILTMIGGYSSIELIDHLDYDLIRANPKILCGYSDITALVHAIYLRTGIVGYIGPHFSTFGMHQEAEYTIESFQHACMHSESPSYTIAPSSTFSDDAWYLDQEKRDIRISQGYKSRGDHSAPVEGTIIGGHAGTLESVLFANYMYDLPRDVILCIESDAEEVFGNFCRHFSTIVRHLGDRLRGVVLGRFQDATEYTDEQLEALFEKSIDTSVPVLYDVNIGHVNPIATYGVGMTGRMEEGRVLVG